MLRGRSNTRGDHKARQNLFEMRGGVIQGPKAVDVRAWRWRLVVEAKLSGAVREGDRWMGAPGLETRCYVAFGLDSPLG